MDFKENKMITARELLILKSTLSNLPKSLRSTFIQIVCRRLGIDEFDGADNITERFQRFFLELDTEMN